MSEQMSIPCAMDILSNIEADDMVLSAAKIAIDALIDALAYRFHDLRIDPDDIPDYEVLCYDEYGEYMTGWIARNDDGAFAEGDAGCMPCCVGWREVPKLEVHHE